MVLHAGAHYAAVAAAAAVFFTCPGPPGATDGCPSIQTLIWSDVVWVLVQRKTVEFFILARHHVTTSPLPAQQIESMKAARQEGASHVVHNKVRGLRV